MQPDLTLDPSITTDEVTAAHDATPSTFTAVSVQDLLDEVGAGQVQPATPAEAIANARALTENGTYVGVGYCLRTVRELEFEIPSLYPDAETAWEQAEQKHLETDPKKIPRGAIVFWTNDRFGHVALSVGGGLCRTTDYRRSGFVGLAPIGALASWCGGRLVGWAEDLNGIDCWPDPKKPMKQVDLSLDRKIVVIRHALRDARTAKQKHRVETLEAWLERLEKKAAKK